MHLGFLRIYFQVNICFDQPEPGGPGDLNALHPEGSPVGFQSLMYLGWLTKSQRT